MHVRHALLRVLSVGTYGELDRAHIFETLHQHGTFIGTECQNYLRVNNEFTLWE
jgi:hypothetical protein